MAKLNGGTGTQAVAKPAGALSSLRPPSLSWPLRYLTALLAATAVFATQRALFPQPSIAPFVLFNVGVVLASWLGGLGPGLLSTAIAAAIGNYFFLAPYDALNLSGPGLAATALFIVSGCVVALVSGSLRSAVLRADDQAKRLHLAKQRMDRAQEIAHLGSWELDLTTNRLEWSDEVYRIFGLEPQEFGATYEAFLEAVHPADREAVNAAYSGSLREGRDSYEIEHRVVRRATGEVRVVHERCEHLRDGTGRITCSVGMVHDITDRKRSEEAVQRSEAIIAQAGAMASLGAWWIDFDHDDDVDANPAHWSPEVFRIFGCQPDQVKVSTAFFYERVHPEDRARVQEAFASALAQRAPYSLEHRVIRPDGAERVVWEHGEFTLDGAGRLRRFVGAVQDITERKHAAAALAERQEQLDLALRAARIGAWHWDIVEDRRVLDRQACALLGIDPERFAGTAQEFFGAVHPDDRERIREALARTVREDATYAPEYRVVWPDGSTRSVVAQGRLMRDETGRPKRVIGVLFDMTERRRMEDALRESHRRKDEFLGVLSHELRNPLAPIRNSLYILQRAPPASEQAKRAHQVVDRQLDHLTHLVDDLLDLTRIGRGKVRLRRDRLDLTELVRRTVDDHRSFFEKHELVVDLPAESLWVDADQTRLAQVIGNLLQNAAKFTPEDGTVRVSLNARAGHADLSVCDTGIGIDAETQKRLFEPFAQADRSLDRSRGGLGLGLALVRELVRMHGGDVRGESRGPGQGARFVVTLPLALGPAIPDVSPGREAAHRPRRILLIEDNADAAESISEALGLSGHQVTVAYDGSSGVARAREVLPEIVICDIGLPGLDGYGVARALRRDPLTSTIYLVALTGYARPEDQQKARESGFDAHLSKPPDLAALERVLAEAPGMEAAPLAPPPS
ncbi:MAG: PAS domain-containing protein [Myxococcales bacterium]